MLAALIVGCRRDESQALPHFDRPVDESYDIFTLSNQPTCSAKIAQKYVDFPEVSLGHTNYHVVLILQKDNQQTVGITGSHVSGEMLDRVNLLRNGLIYQFPRALQLNFANPP